MSGRAGGARARALALAALVALLASPAAVRAGPPLARDQALREATSPDPGARRRAIDVLGEVGVMADAPLLLGALRDPDPLVRALAQQSVWQVWSRSGDAEVDRLFQAGVEQMRRGAGPEAVEIFTRIIEKQPDFAEGWNKRATVYYLMGEYEKSLRDCDEVMKRNPSHFGALSGYGQIHLQLGEVEKALGYFERALAVNPNLTEVEAAVEQLRAIVVRKRRDTI